MKSGILGPGALRVVPQMDHKNFHSQRAIKK
ncbi:hypothetical protein SAMN00768000_1464 [Sulfobacillus thermosulfidooxidans DSM 9293]|uniref:Uncharacterized protein n=1 Tax=Sulfobacillus thermosulfidooxidans (strain DSM 9293 / VKM B-1269 / AT-1) TaxID=929705 RepID=A0A1W1WD39_SULTA|nr:hypothetical protein SAMN00768000_1464 [Sulfobacillus thermosulfidooxidans DSM 9293]